MNAPHKEAAEAGMRRPYLLLQGMAVGRLRKIAEAVQMMSPLSRHEVVSQEIAYVEHQ